MTTTKKRQNTIEDPAALLAQLADRLTLTALREKLPLLLAQAQLQAPSYSQFALQLLQCEANSRDDRRLTRNLKRSGLPQLIEDLDSFDFSLRPNLEPSVVKELLNCRWAQEQGRNIICLGRPGLGKSRILDTLAHAACLRGYSVCKIITAELLELLQASLVDASYHRTFKRFEKYDVLYLDEFGYAPFDDQAGKHLFRLVSARYRQRSILLAANTGFKNWKPLFSSESAAVATVDRLIDQATILRFSGKSFRNPKEILGDEID